MCMYIYIVLSYKANITIYNVCVCVGVCVSVCEGVCVGVCVCVCGCVCV